jgi:hypothetical protein
VKLLGMLGSNHPGERAAAASKSDQLVRIEHKLMWADVIMVPATPSQSHSLDWRTPYDFATLITRHSHHASSISSSRLHVGAGNRPRSNTSGSTTLLRDCGDTHDRNAIPNR